MLVTILIYQKGYLNFMDAGFRQRFMMNTAKAALNDEVSIVNSGM